MPHLGPLWSVDKIVHEVNQKKSGFEYFASLPIKNVVENDQTAKKIVLLHVDFLARFYSNLKAESTRILKKITSGSQGREQRLISGKNNFLVTHHVTLRNNEKLRLWVLKENRSFRPAGHFV